MARVEIRQIGITKVGTDAIVNAANEGLLAGSGVCGAIFEAAGMSQLTEACNAIGHCDTGSAVITPGFKLSRYIIHAVGPRWSSDEGKVKMQLYGAYKSALTLAVNNGCKSIGFPLISSGIFGVPVDIAWRKALQACDEFDGDIEIVFAVLDKNILAVGEKTLSEIASKVQSTASQSITDKMIIFHDPDKTYGFMSNWYLSDFDIGDVTYSSVEQYLMYRKAELFHDSVQMKNIMATNDPKSIQQYGRKVEQFNGVLWNGMRPMILYEAVEAKFRQNPELSSQLLATGDAILVEGTDSDKIFANGLKRDDRDRFDMSKWQGQNLLGFTLMEVRKWESWWQDRFPDKSKVY